MSEQFNLNNLTLDDNTFEVIPDGDYHFTVASHEIQYSTSEKLPPNTQMVVCHLEIPFMKDGELKTAKVRNNLNIYSKALFAIRQFVECIGMAPEKGKVNLDLEKMDGLTGVCAITTRESSNGNEYNQVQSFYPPSKVPATTANDEAWANKDKDLFLDLPEGDIPV